VNVAGTGDLSELETNKKGTLIVVFEVAAIQPGVRLRPSLVVTQSVVPDVRDVAEVLGAIEGPVHPRDHLQQHEDR
jgi:hypothetical protein